MPSGAEKKDFLSTSTSRIVARGTLGAEPVEVARAQASVEDDGGIHVEVSLDEGDDQEPKTWRPTTPEELERSRQVIANARPESPHARVSDTEPPPTVDDTTDALASSHSPPTCGRYELCCEIAQGGMATLFLARQSGPRGFEKFVALKRIHPSMLDEPQFVDMFFDEARIASRISHPNVCSVVDFGEADGNYFIAMEHLLGLPLSMIRRRIAEDSEVLDKARTPLLRVIADAAEGLHAAHELRDDLGNPLHVVHRDISPPNLLVTFDGNTKVLDFGIAKASNRTHKTSTGVLKGHLAYMSPEQFSGAPIDRRSDIWALGVVLWELLTGKRLFDGSDFQILHAVTHNEIPWPSRVHPGVPPALDFVVMKALTKAPEQRYATAREMSRDITRILSKLDEPIGMPEVSEWIVNLFDEERARQLRVLAEARNA